MKYPIVVFIMGRPGAGKDTQAKLLAENLQLISISTSELLKAKLYNKSKRNDDIIIKEKKIFESGVLNTPSWVLGVIKVYVKKLEKKDFDGKNGIIFSGSPRTFFEAENLIPFLESIFTKESMVAIYLNVSEDEGIRRIVQRNKISPRSLDSGKEKLQIRTKEFNTRTEPVLEYLEEKGILITINGEQSPEKVYEDILQVVRKKL